jgi:hypothetical protein
MVQPGVPQCTCRCKGAEISGGGAAAGAVLTAGVRNYSAPAGSWTTSRCSTGSGSPQMRAATAATSAASPVVRRRSEPGNNTLDAITFKDYPYNIPITTQPRSGPANRRIGIDPPRTQAEGDAF